MPQEEERLKQVIASRIQTELLERDIKDEIECLKELSTLPFIFHCYISDAAVRLPITHLKKYYPQTFLLVTDPLDWHARNQLNIELSPQYKLETRFLAMAVLQREVFERVHNKISSKPYRVAACTNWYSNVRSMYQSLNSPYLHKIDELISDTIDRCCAVIVLVFGLSRLAYRFNLNGTRGNTFFYRAFVEKHFVFGWLLGLPMLATAMKGRISECSYRLYLSGILINNSIGLMRFYFASDGERQSIITFNHQIGEDLFSFLPAPLNEAPYVAFQLFTSYLFLVKFSDWLLCPLMKGLMRWFEHKMRNVRLITHLSHEEKSTRALVAKLSLFKEDRDDAATDAADTASLPLFGDEEDEVVEPYSGCCGALSRLYHRFCF